MSKPPQDYYRIQSISQIKKILICRSQVLVRVLYNNEEATTPSGVIKIGDTDFQPAEHANRISEVVMVPDALHYHLTWHKKNPNANESMPWKTDMQLQVGDIVWHDYMDSLNCPMIDVDDEPGVQYKLLNYYDLYVAKRYVPNLEATVVGDIVTLYDGNTYIAEDGGVSQIIPLNGYLLCEEVMEDKLSDLDVLDKHVDKRYGKIAFIGKKNYEYRWEQIGGPPKGQDRDGNEILDVGDVIIKKNPQIHIMLESHEHARFNGSKMYFIIQRKDIYAKKI